MKQTRPHLQISPLGLVNKNGSKNPKEVKNEKAIGKVAKQPKLAILNQFGPLW